MDGIHELISKKNASVATFDRYLADGDISSAEYDCCKADALDKFAQAKAELIEKHKSSRTTQEASGSSAQRAAEANTSTADVQPVASTADVRPVASTADVQPVADSSGVSAGSEKKRARSEPHRYQPGDDSIFVTSEYRTSDADRCQSGEVSELTLRARNFLPTAWKILHGKGKQRGKYVYVNPDGKPYVLGQRPVQGKDFFVSAQEAVMFTIDSALEQYTRESNVEKVKETVMLLKSFLEDQHAALLSGHPPNDPAPSEAPTAKGSSSSAPKRRRATAVVIDLEQSPAPQPPQQQANDAATAIVLTPGAASGAAAVPRNVPRSGTDVSVEEVQDEDGYDDEWSDSESDLESP
jgi:hypothetical protein